MLGFFGLDDEVESVYRVLIGDGVTSPATVAAQLGHPVEQVAAAMRELERLGLAAPCPELPGRYRAAPPAMALGAVLSERRHELRQAELAVETLTQEYRRSTVGLALNDLVEVVIGVEAVRHRFDQLQLGAEHEMLALVTGVPVAVTGMDNDSEPVAVARGVSYRVVLERAVLESPEGGLALAEALDRGEQVRVVDRVPTKLMMADREVAMLPLSALDTPGEPAVLVVRAGGMLEALVGLFESVWQHALPIRLSLSGVPQPDTGEQPDSVDLQILSMLLVGMTDVSVAKQLDLGLRTVQRRVRRLMDITGLTTRMQLGWHAYERGWVVRR
ncbi:helix-turn-helix transcriptional regulator [Streptacidiphilus sp. PB12-B1b]|uniref:helix-turn-helix transcriptional regulator n=1 Tax=Streptacidiphilus sp. PB12-B1b TaxID=2705012 RepID=UPI0015FAFED9|nr:helix-turn-helix transcriptional regulator [Streptacidiphilus sp. PB12-B1b]QMU75996.1 helix-turn-helix transcriptional regulator [Streptacidiphilus sp. PB12-B1b]